MDLFFVLSGFVIAYSYSTRIASFHYYRVFIKKRLARLYPLHLLTLLTYVCIGLASLCGTFTVIGPNKYRFSSLLSNITLTQAWGFSAAGSFNTVSWSISAECAAYLLFPCILYLVRRRFALGTFVLALLYAACLYLCHRVFKEPLSELAWNCGFIRALPSFTLGTWLYLNLDRVSSLFSNQAAVILFWISSLWWTATVSLSLNDYEGLASASFVVIFAVIAEHRGALRYISHPWLSRRGDLTYSIYMLHPVLATVVISGIAPKLLGRSREGIIGAILVATAATYVLAKVSFKYFETPARKWWMRSLGRTDHPAKAQVQGAC